MAWLWDARVARRLSSDSAAPVPFGEMLPLLHDPAGKRVVPNSKAMPCWKVKWAHECQKSRNFS